ncbi:Uncharacterized protein TCM_028294 [Theobroma cacao]|uniref:Uncharacterized protein n=1 Tax=Theobroma cacao TaxID=3641 RepID=A0A061GAB0_THECC|nr:Uncharacterized protein TCM_028294 [Theobroma cacao]
MYASLRLLKLTCCLQNGSQVHSVPFKSEIPKILSRGPDLTQIQSNFSRSTRSSAPKIDAPYRALDLCSLVSITLGAPHPRSTTQSVLPGSTHNGEHQFGCSLPWVRSTPLSAPFGEGRFGHEI